jgi:FKBP-type peptidyl-prolyl cis-trans isomerase FkpA
VNKAISLLLGLALWACAAAVDAQDQPGLDYWNGIYSPAIETESGLQYKVRHMGKGSKPRGNTVHVHYRGMLLNGVVFDSSYDEDEPVKFNLRRVIKGWAEGIRLMPEGSVFIFLIPPELAYGEKGTDGIPPNSPLLFEVELY